MVHLKNKIQILLVFSNDARYQWSLDYKKQYIYALRESHTEEKVKSLEDFCNGISSEEKHRTAKDILCFLYLLNPIHISKHLAEISNAKKTIAEWCKNLPS